MLILIDSMRDLDLKKAKRKVIVIGANNFNDDNATFYTYNEDWLGEGDRFNTAKRVQSRRSSLATDLDEVQSNTTSVLSDVPEMGHSTRVWEVQRFRSLLRVMQDAQTSLDKLVDRMQRNVNKDTEKLHQAVFLCRQRLDMLQAFVSLQQYQNSVAGRTIQTSSRPRKRPVEVIDLIDDKDEGCNAC